jgi:hypothetical protein
MNSIRSPVWAAPFQLSQSPLDDYFSGVHRFLPHRLALITNDNIGVFGWNINMEKVASYRKRQA